MKNQLYACIHAADFPVQALLRLHPELESKPVAVLEVVKDTTAYEAAASSSQRNLLLGTAVILAGAVLLAFLLGRGLSRPLVVILVE